MFEIGSRIVHKDSPNVFDKSWEVMSVSDDIVLLGGPGPFELCVTIHRADQWDYVLLVAESLP